MANEVTVDAKPMEKLPYDPNDIPDAVKKRVAAVEALYTANGSDGQQQQPLRSAGASSCPPSRGSTSADVGTQPQPRPPASAEPSPRPPKMMVRNAGELEASVRSHAGPV